MFDFAWSEIALIVVVALIAIGPKDMPVAIKAISDMMKKLRRMAGEFQGHVDELIREADLGEVKSTFDELRGMNIKGAMQRAIDPDGALRGAFTDPFRDHPVQPVMTPIGPTQEVETIQPPLPPDFPPPAFIPPGTFPPAAVQPSFAPAPAFIPPEAPPPAETA